MRILKGGDLKRLTVKDRMRVKVSGKIHYIGLVELTGTNAKLRVMSESQDKVLSVGDEWRLTLKEVVWLIFILN